MSPLSTIKKSFELLQKIENFRAGVTNCIEQNQGWNEHFNGKNGPISKLNQTLYIVSCRGVTQLGGLVTVGPTKV